MTSRQGIEVRFGQRASALVLVALAVLTAAGAGAGTGDPEVAGADLAVIGGDFRVSGGSASGDDEVPAVAWNGTEYLVVWEDLRAMATRGYDIFGQRLSATGTPLGSNFRISGTSAISHDRAPEVIWSGTEYLVVWSDGRGSTYDIYGQRVSATGGMLGGNFRISATTAQFSYSPAVAWNQTGNQYLVVWSDGRSYATRGYDIFGQRLSAAGALVGGNFRISNSNSNERVPAVAWNQTANQFLVVWEDWRDSATRGSDVYGQRVSATGGLLGGNLRTCGGAATRDDVKPAVAWNPKANQYLVVWHDWRSSSTVGVQVFGQRLSATGVWHGTNFRIGGPSSWNNAPGMVWNNTAQEYLVVWADSRNSATRGADIYAQRVTPNGSLAGLELRISGPAATDWEDGPAVAWNHVANQYLVVWADARNDATRGWDIFGRRASG